MVAKSIILLLLLSLLFPFSTFAAAPTLETNAAADTLRITAGTSGDPVTWNDVWDWDDGGGSSGGDGDVPKDGGGTAKVNTFMTETIADGVYIILKHAQFGNATPDATYFQSENEMVYFVDDKIPTIMSSATLELGDLLGDWGEKGSYWSIGEYPWDFIAAIETTATFLQYASMIGLRGADYGCILHEGTVDMRNSIWIGERATLELLLQLNSLIIDRVFLNNFYIRTSRTANTCRDLHTHGSVRGIYPADWDDVIVENMTFSNIVEKDVYILNSTGFTLLNPVTMPTTFDFQGATDACFVKYTVNIHVVDKDGNDVPTANVDCNDTNGTDVFNVNTDASGDIAEQTVTYKRWLGTSEVETDYSPHTFIVSKDGYLTHKFLYNFSDGKPDWEIKLFKAPYTKILGVE